MTLEFEGFSIQDFIHYIYFPILILDKVPEKGRNDVIAVVMTLQGMRIVEIIPPNSKHIQTSLN